MIVIHLKARPTIAALLDEADEIAKAHGVVIVRVVAYRDTDGVRGSIFGWPA